MTERGSAFDHKSFLAQLPPETRAMLQARSDRAGLGHLAIHWGLIALIALTIWAAPNYWWALIPVQGVLITSNFFLCHECTHKTPFKNNMLNEVVGYVSGALIGLLFLRFRYFHMAHHRYTNDPERDPELTHLRAESVPGYLWYVSGLPYWYGQGRELIQTVLGSDMPAFVPQAAQRRVRVESLIVLILYVSIAIYSCIGSSIFVKIFILPALCTQPLLRLYLLAEHGRCPFVANMFENTRTTLTNSTVRFLAWNMPFHAEHHAMPNVPFHRLPALHTLANPHLKVVENGYVRFSKSYFKSL